MSANKRDTEQNSHPDYKPVDPKQTLDSLISVLQYLVSSNEGTELPPLLINTYGSFASPWTYEWATVEEYLSRLMEWIVCGPECFIVAMCVLKKLEAVAAVPPITQTSVHRIYLTCLMLGVKFVEDETLCNADFAKVGCVDVSELNQMERTAFLALGCNVAITPEEYEATKAELEMLDKSIRKGKRKLMKESATFLSLVNVATDNKKKNRWSLTKKDSLVGPTGGGLETARNSEKRFSLSLFKARASKRLSQKAIVDENAPLQFNGVSKKPKVPSRRFSTTKAKKTPATTNTHIAKKTTEPVAFFNRQDSL